MAPGTETEVGTRSSSVPGLAFPSSALITVLCLTFSVVQRPQQTGSSQDEKVRRPALFVVVLSKHGN